MSIVLTLTRLEAVAVRDALTATLGPTDDDERRAYFGDGRGVAAACRAETKLRKALRA